MRAGSPPLTRLPPIAGGRRRGLLAQLVVVAVLHAALGVTTAVLTGRLVAAGPALPKLLMVAAAAGVVGIGVTRYGERVLAERLGQDYVHELRVRLVASALTAPDAPSLGITIARTTNDLTAVRNWVGHGIAPLIAAVPLVVSSVVVLGLLNWRLAIATSTPILLMLAVLVLAGRVAHRRAGRLRRRRGRLASRLSDTLHARHEIQAAGGNHRELRRIEAESARVVDAAVSRARVAGLMQAASMTTAAAIAVLVALTGLVSAVEPAAIATGLTIAGVLGSPLSEVGRIQEFRQNFRAARRVLARHVAVSPAIAGLPAPRARYRALSGVGTLHVEPAEQPGLSFHARAGDRVRLCGADAERVTSLLRAIACPPDQGGVRVVVDGWDLSRVDARRRRELVGVAARGAPLERGTIARAVRYRRPDLPADHGRSALERVGLSATIARLPKGERTELRHGGEPLSVADRARLHVARASLGDPRVLVLDHVDADLDDDGVAALRAVVADHPGIVVFASAHPDLVAPHHRAVRLG